MMHFVFSQSIQPTKEQQIAIDSLFTPEKIIEYSKTISNEKEQYKIIKSLEAKIDSLKSAALKKDLLVQNYINEIKFLNDEIYRLNNEENDVSDTQLDNSKKPFLGLHLKSRLFLQEFKLNRVNFSLNLSYDLKQFSFGVNGQSLSIQNTNNTYESKLFYGAFIDYKIF